MIKLRRSQERGHVKLDWLDSYHSFSFSGYYDPAHMQYSTLRVINEDVVEGGAGFGMHPHRNMEIVTYILAGSLRHQDSIGNVSVIGGGCVQRMTAGTGVHHSEFNASTDSTLHLLQIWVTPSEQNLIPSYEEKYFSTEQKQNRWCLIVSPNGQDTSITIHQDAYIYSTVLSKGHELPLTLQPNRCAYLQLAKGEVLLDGHLLQAGDAAMLEDAAQFELLAETDAELILFDLVKM